MKTGVGALKILISVTEAQEVAEAVKGGADIIDVKNPKEGSLGASFPWIIREIKKQTQDSNEISAAIGDMPNLPGTASLAALGAASSGADYVKIGLRGVSHKKEAIYLMTQVVRAVKEYDDSIRVVGAGYSDVARTGSVPPLLIPEIVEKSGGDIAMLDTGVKDGKKLFEFLDFRELKNFVDDAHELGLSAALAGSLTEADVGKLAELGADVAGFRGAACSNNDRREGRVRRERVERIMKAAEKYKARP